MESSAQARSFEARTRANMIDHARRGFIRRIIEATISKGRWSSVVKDSELRERRNG